MINHKSVPIAGHPPMSAVEGATRKELFRKLLLAVSVMAGVTHLCFLWLFYKNGIMALAAVNIASSLCYMLAFSFLQRHQLNQAWVLIAGEAVAHGILAVYLIGWDSGFHLYILLGPQIVVVSIFDKWRVKVPFTVSLVILYMGLDLLLRHATPSYILERSILDGLYYFNLFTVLLFLIGLASIYYGMVVQSERQLREMAVTDPLTSLRNRRGVLASAEVEAAKHRRDGRPLSFVLCDLDHFKSINDTHGHETGDKVLQAVSHVLRSAVREGDHAARWGGEEFLVLLPETEPQGAMLVANRLRESVAALAVPGKNGPLSISMTMGVSSLRPNEPIEQAIARADKALYKGKHGGRDRVELADEYLVIS